MPVLLPKERVGSRIADKYQLDSILGRGGMGVVYKGTHVWTGRPVAVKVMGPEYAEDEQMAKRFLREARSAASLRHPNVVDVLDMGRDDDGSVYLVLEHLRGHSLGDRLDEQGVLSIEETLAILFPVMDALTEAHNLGIVHRDLKPDNIFLGLDGKGEVVPKLLDFGVAKVLRSGSAAATQTGTVLGTPHYMSPEQARGSTNVGPASDVWALGVVMYQCLTGRLVYDTGELLTTLSAIATGPDPIIELPDVHPAMRRALERALRKDLNERFADMEAFGLAVRLAAHAAKIDVRPELLPRVRSVPAGTPEERAAYRRSERPPMGSELPAPRVEVRGPTDVAMRGSVPPTVVERIPNAPLPRFELEIPADALPPAPAPKPRSEPAPVLLELDVRAMRPSQERSPVVGPGALASKRSSGWGAFSGWYENAPSEVRQVVKALLFALLVSISYGVGMAVWRAL